MARALMSRLLLAMTISTLSASGGTYRVGPSRSITTLQQVAGLLMPGDTVLVDGDTAYPGGVVFSRPGTGANPILIRGEMINGRRPIIQGGTNGVAFTTGSTSADHYIFEGFEVRNASFRGVYHQADDLVLRNLIVHDCYDGLMGADNGSGSLLLEYSEFFGNGSGTGAHQIYMATDEIAHPGSVFLMRFCWVHDGAGGNNVKSRSERNEVYYNWIEGAVYHELELIGPDPAGGVPAGLKREDSDVVGNVLWKRANAYGGTGTFFVTRFGGDGTGASRGRYRVVNNTIIMGTSAAFRLFDSLESVEMHNNVFYSNSGSAAPIIRTVEAAWASGLQISGQNNWVQNILTTIPASWTGTITGNDPGFRSFNSGDLTPADGSPLIDSGTSAPQSPPGFNFPDPLFPAACEPPQHTLLPPAGGVARPVLGNPDIGAYEHRPATGARHSGPAALFQVWQNYPNPFNPSTTIRYSLPQGEHVNLSVYNTLGQLVSTLVNGEEQAGYHEARFDGTALASGIYFCRMQAGSDVITMKLVLSR